MSDDPDAPARDAPDTDRRSRTERRKGERRTQDVPVERDRRRGADRRQGSRRKRSMNQYDMDADVLEFIGAINRFKERSGRPFPTWSEVLEILRGLGYEKQA